MLHEDRFEMEKNKLCKCIELVNTLTSSGFLFCVWFWRLFFNSKKATIKTFDTLTPLLAYWRPSLFKFAPHWKESLCLKCGVWLLYLFDTGCVSFKGLQRHIYQYALLILHLMISLFQINRQKQFYCSPPWICSTKSYDY